MDGEVEIMSIEKVRAYLRERGAEDRVMEFSRSTATVPEAAAVVGVEPARIAKTLTFKNRAGDGCLIVVAAGDARVDNHGFRDRFGLKARMCSPEEAVRYTGHAVGGVCPFAVPAGTPVYLDESLKRFDTVFPAAGNAQSAVRLTPEELYALSGAQDWVRVCKIPEAE